MSRNCIAKINLTAIKQNYLYAKSLAPKSKIIAIIKADAYGHGAVEVAKYLADTADIFGVTCIEEAIELRKSGVLNKPILLLEGIFEISELKLVEKYNLLQVICNKYQLQWLLDTKLKKPTKVFVKYDSGMNRIGFYKKDFKEAVHALEASKNIAEIVLMTHLSKSYKPYDAFTQKQIDDFNSITNKTSHCSSIANSAGIIAWRDSHKEYNRPGIMLYGSSPLNEIKYQKNLIPAMTLSSPLISIRRLKKGCSIGYGHRFTCEQDMQIGTVAIGYADGYPQQARDGTPVYINNTRSRVVGRVSMDITTIDLTGVPNPKIGDRVEMFGENISINEVAKFSDTISYEILSKITKRVYRNYLY